MWSRGEWHRDAPELRDYIRNHTTAYWSTNMKDAGGVHWSRVGC